MQRVIGSGLLLILIASLSIFAQEERKASKPEIPELREMHHFIHPMWHDAYPAKDTEQLKELYPKLQGQYEKLKNASFPEQWEDKKLHWNEGVTQMGQTLKNYQQAMDTNDAEALLLAARTLHDDFEGWRMLINPPIPELDDFHKTLYYVYHDYLPEKNWEMLKSSIPEFEKKVQALQEAKLPKWMENNKQKFTSSLHQLQEAVDELASLKDSDDEQALTTAVENIHTAYVNLEGCMD